MLGWGTDALTQAGGQYRLCWCADSLFQCVAAEDFRTDVGEFLLVGPSPLSQDRTCVSGQTCTLDGIQGSHLAYGNKFMALDTCGTNSILPRHAGAGLLMSATAEGSVVGWGSIPVSAAGGLYRLCWCGEGSAALECTAAASFRTDAGALTLIGPSTLEQDRTCVSGLTCLLDGLEIQDSSASDEVLVLDTCATGSTVRGFSGAGRVVVVASSGTVVGWGTSAVTASGGQYRLCWCAAANFDCSKTQQFHVDLGGLSLIGVGPLNQDRTCISGQTCILGGIVGNVLQYLDEFFVLDTCSGSANSLLPRFPMVGTYGLGEVIDFRGGAGTQVSAAGGVYRLCWCASALSAGVGCDLLGSFKADAGSLTIIGPSPLYQARTCVSGQTCLLDGIVGQDLADGDKLVMLDTCGSASLPRRMPDTGYIALSAHSGATASWGTTRLSVAGGQYRLCWCAASVLPCERATDYRVDAGELTVVGAAPLNQDRTCVSGQSCTLAAISGTWLSTEDRYLVLDTCGVQGASVLQSAGVPIGESVTGYGTEVSWGAFPVTAAGGEYRLCWCSETHYPLLRSLPSSAPPGGPGSPRVVTQGERFRQFQGKWL